MRLLVFGTRAWRNLNPDVKQELVCWVYAELDELWDSRGRPKDLLLINGKATGIDSIARSWSVDNDLSALDFPITNQDWNKYKNGAGPRRNETMLREGDPEVAMEFPGGSGTFDMSQRLKKADVPIIVPATSPPAILSSLIADLAVDYAAAMARVREPY